MTSEPGMCSKPFCDGPCDAELHETPAALQAIIGATGSACPDCDSAGFGFVTEFRMDGRPVHLLVLWHQDACPSLVNGGYLIANLPETALKTAGAIEEALMCITGADIRTAGASRSHDKMIARHDRGEVVLPERTVRTARRIAAREALQEEWQAEVDTEAGGDLLDGRTWKQHYDGMGD